MVRLTVLLLLFILPVDPSVFGQRPGEIGYEDVSEMPGGKRGQRLKALIDAFNANDGEAVARFIREETTAEFEAMAPMEMHQEAFMSIYRQSGPIQFHSVRNYTPARENEIVMIYPDQHYGSWRAVSLSFEDSEEQRISNIGFNSARRPSNVAPEPALTQEVLISEVSGLMERVCDKDVFSGTVLLARGGEVLFEKACGEASKRFGVANNMDTKFNLGSMNKMFTATAIMQLVEAGKIKLDDPISKYLDDSWLAKSVADQVKVHHLLSHTSGLGSYFNAAYWDSSRELYRNVADFKPLVSGDTLAFEPGERFRYSNTGMLLLGVIIEAVSGQDYFSYIREHIYQPAGMQHSDAYEMDEPVPNLAIGYIPDPNSEYGWRNNIFKHVIKGGPAGGGYATARDLHRFAQALQSEKLISKSSLEKMWTAHSEQSYGYGFGVETANEAVGKVVGHSGGFPGLNGNMDIFLDKGYTVIVLSNYDGGAMPVARRIYDMIGRLGLQ